MARAICSSRSRSASVNPSQRGSFSARTLRTISSARSRREAMVGTTSSEASQRSKRLCSASRMLSARFASASRPLALRSTICLHVVDVVEADTGDLAAGGLDISGYGDVDQQQRPPVAPDHHLLEIVALEDVVGRVGRGDDDVGRGELRRKLVEADRLAAEALGEADRAVVMAVGDEDGGDPARAQRPRDQLRGLTGSDHEDPPAGEVAERALCEFDRDRGDREPLLAHPGLLARPAARGERPAEEAVEDRPGGSLDQRQLVGALHLSLDLRLADDHRVEPRGDPEEVARRLGRTQRVEMAEQLGRPDVGLAGEHPQRRRLGLDRVGDDEVELGPVAGRDRRRLAHLLGGGELAEHARPPGPRSAPGARAARAARSCARRRAPATRSSVAHLLGDRLDLGVAVRGLGGPAGGAASLRPRRLSA